MLRIAMWTTIKTLWDLGYNKTRIAETVGCSRKTVRKILKWIQQDVTVPRNRARLEILKFFITP